MTKTRVSGLLVAFLVTGCGTAEEPEGPLTPLTDTKSETAPDMGASDSTDTMPPGPADSTTSRDDTESTEEDTESGPTIQVTVTPNLVDFGTTPLGVTKNAQFILTNSGTEKVNISSADFVSGENEGFAYVDEAPLGLLVPGEKRTVELKFTTSTVGSHTATLSFDMLPASPAPVQVKLKAIALVQGTTGLLEIAATSPSLAFGAVPVGEQSAMDFEFVNSSSDALQILQLGLSAESSAHFKVETSKEPPLILGPGSTLLVHTTYNPAVAGLDSGVIEVATSSIQSPVLAVPLAGSGYSGNCAGALTCAPDALVFKDVDPAFPAMQVLICSNTGLGPIEVSGITVELSEADGFSVEPEPGLTTLPPGTGIAFPITYKPTSLVGSVSGEITVNSNDCSQPAQTISVTGNGKETITIPDCLAPTTFDSSIEWEWSPSDGENTLSRVAMTPIVVDLDQDDSGVPEVVFVAHDNPLEDLNDDQPGILRAIHGDNGTAFWANTNDNHRPSWLSNLAAGELDGQPGPEIIAVAYRESPPGTKCPGVPEILPATFCGKYLTGHLLAFHGADGSLFWKSQPFTGAVTDLENMAAPNIADLDGDGLAEIILGSHVYSGLTGHLLWVGSGGRGNDGHGFMSLVADVNGDGSPNVIAGNTAYNWNGTTLWTATTFDTSGTAAADLDQDGDMEVFINAPNGTSVIVDGKTGTVVAGPINSGIIGCCVASPAVANVDSSKPGLEIITVGDDQLKVYDHDLNLLWAVPVTDDLGASGPAAFDVEGDGSAEIVYADRTLLRILRGTDGSVVFQAERSALLGLDNPVIADVDGDGHAEILVALDDPDTTAGLRLYAPEGASWVGTRRIWNQHAYVSGQVLENGVIPPGTSASGLLPPSLRINPAYCQ